jgi:hypothetical protein
MRTVANIAAKMKKAPKTVRRWASVGLNGVQLKGEKLASNWLFTDKEIANFCRKSGLVNPFKSN